MSNNQCVGCSEVLPRDASFPMCSECEECARVEAEEEESNAITLPYIFIPEEIDIPKLALAMGIEIDAASLVRPSSTEEVSGVRKVVRKVSGGFQDRAFRRAGGAR